MENNFDVLRFLNLKEMSNDELDCEFDYVRFHIKYCVNNDVLKQLCERHEEIQEEMHRRERQEEL